MNNLQKIRNVYFLGIGGIGMSALARYFKFTGRNVAGYDRTPTALTDDITERKELMCILRMMFVLFRKTGTRQKHWRFLRPHYPTTTMNFRGSGKNPSGC